MVVLCNQVTKVVDVRIHEDFQADDIQKGSDIAILILTDSSQAQPISLPTKGVTPNQMLLALGWEKGSPKLQQTYLEPVSQDECIQSYPGLGTDIHCARSKFGKICKGMLAMVSLVFVARISDLQPTTIFGLI